MKLRTAPGVPTQVFWQGWQNGDLAGSQPKQELQSSTSFLSAGFWDEEKNTQPRSTEEWSLRHCSGTEVMNWYWSCSVLEFQLYHFTIWNMFFTEIAAHTGRDFWLDISTTVTWARILDFYRGVRHMRLYGYVGLCNSRKNMWKVQESSWKQYESGSKLRVVVPKNVSKVWDRNSTERSAPFPRLKGSSSGGKVASTKSKNKKGKIPIRKTRESWYFWIGRPDIFNTFWYISCSDISNQPGGPTTR